MSTPPLARSASSRLRSPPVVRLVSNSMRTGRSPINVLVSSTVKDLVAGSQIAFEPRGEHVLKGVPGEWRVFRATPGAA